MSNTEEFVNFLGFRAARRNQKAQIKFLEKVSNQGLDTIFASESLFKGTVLDFEDVNSLSGGKGYADYSITVN